ncbi:MAG: ribosome recycling factor [Candidatus Gracilibacteria bacterium]
MLPQNQIDDATAQMKKAIEHLKDEFSKLQVGRATPALVEDVKVDAYGSLQPLKAVASVSVPDAKTIQIQPWDRGLLGAIEKGIQIANIGLTPNNDGVYIRINIPPLTEERRKDLVKVVSRYSEEAKITIRNTRQDTNNSFNAMKKNSEMTEDELHAGMKVVQDHVDRSNREIEEMSKKKEQDIMTV